MTIGLSQDLSRTLIEYAEIYAETYGCVEPVSELIPSILQSFLESDRAFMRARGRRAEATMAHHK